jgi:hypothetical protein
MALVTTLSKNTACRLLQFLYLIFLCADRGQCDANDRCVRSRSKRKDTRCSDYAFHLRTCAPFFTAPIRTLQIRTCILSSDPRTCILSSPNLSHDTNYFNFTPRPPHIPVWGIFKADEFCLPFSSCAAARHSHSKISNYEILSILECIS